MSTVRADVLVAAKREVQTLVSAGRIMTPKEAWLMAGHVQEQQTLWSVAMRVAARHDCSPEELNRYLEHHFPRFANATQHVDWEDIKRGDSRLGDGD